MSNILPYENIIFQTRLPKAEVLKRLEENIEPRKGYKIEYHNARYVKPYIGIITGNTFDMERAIEYRNSFLPMIHGEVLEDYRGTIIKVTMMPHKFVIGMMAFMALFISTFCVAIFPTLFTEEFQPQYIIPYVILVGLLGLVFLAPRFEMKISKKDLTKIFEAEIAGELPDT